MKKYILSFSFLISMAACNNPTTTTEEIESRAPDTVAALIDAPKPTVNTSNLGYGLTLEEMQDDTVFADGSEPTSWEVAGITDVKGFKLFIKKAQLMVLNNDKEALAKIIRYPLNKTIQTEQDFIKNYDQVFTKDVKLSIAKINFSQIFRNSKGAMSDGGMVWFSQDGDQFKIIAVNS